jgi:hypothetical protein
MGTPGYMSPEQARAARTLDGRSDLFGLGCILYECLGGLPAFSGQDVTAMMCKIVLVDPPPIETLWRETPPELAALLRALLAKDAERRPPDARAVAEALEGMRVPDAPARAWLDARAAGPRRGAGAGGGFASCVVLAGARAGRRGARPALGDDDAARATHVLEALGASVERLLDGTIVGVIGATDAAAAADQAALAALALRASLPDADVAAALGPERAADPLQEAVTRGAAAFAATAVGALRGETPPAGAVRLDDALARLLPAGYDVARVGNAAWLSAKR